MSPFSHFLHELRMRHGVRQIDLAELIGYEQSHISALEAGAKGPPTQEFMDRLQSVLDLSEDEARNLKATDASQRKLVIDADMPQYVYWLLSRLRTSLRMLTPTQVRVINDVLSMPASPTDAWFEPRRRLRRGDRWACKNELVRL